MSRIVLLALLLAAPLNAQNQEALEDSGWYWYEKAAVEGFLAGAAVGGLAGVIYCNLEPSYMDVAPPRGNCENDERESESIESESIKASAKLALIGSLVGIPVALLIRSTGRDGGEDTGTELRVGPDPYRPERVSVEIRLPLQP